MNNNFKRKLGVIIAIIMFFVIPLTFLRYGGNIPWIDDAYYNETLNISIIFPEDTEYSILFPAILSGESLTPSLYKIDTIYANFSYKSINNILYLEINGSHALLGIIYSVFRSDIPDDPNAYEELLSNHQYDHNIGDNFISVFLFADQGAQIDYSIKAETNSCSINAKDQILYDRTIEPGETKYLLDQSTFLGTCN